LGSEQASCQLANKSCFLFGTLPIELASRGFDAEAFRLDQSQPDEIDGRRGNKLAGDQK